MSLKVAQFNVRGLAPKTLTFNTFVLQHQLDILLLSEVKVRRFYDYTSLKFLPLLPGYALHYESARCGFFYRTSLNATPLELRLDSATGVNDSSHAVHATGLVVPQFSLGKPLLFLSLYCPSTASTDAILNFFTSVTPSSVSTTT